MSTRDGFAPFNATIKPWLAWQDMCSYIRDHKVENDEWYEHLWSAAQDEYDEQKVRLDQLQEPDIRYQLAHMMTGCGAAPPRATDDRGLRTAFEHIFGRDATVNHKPVLGKERRLGLPVLRNMLKRALRDMNKDKVIVTYAGEIRFNYTVQNQLCACAEDLGAAAVLYLTGFPGPPNMYVHVHHGRGYAGRCNIPLVTAHIDDYFENFGLADGPADASSRLINECEVNKGLFPLMELELDYNPWQMLWDSALFVLLFKLMLPIVNLLMLPLAMYGIYKHVQNLRTTPTHLTYHFLTYAFKDSTCKWMLLGLVLEFSSCLLRGVWLLGGPLYSTGVLTFTAQTHLRITAPQEIMTIFISIMLFSRFNQLAPFGSRFIKRIFTRGVKCCFVVIWLALLIITVYRNHLVASGEDLYKHPVQLVMIFFQPIVVLSTGILFISEGIRFYRCLMHAEVPSSGCQRAMRKAVIWLMVGGCAELAWVVPELIQIFGSLGSLKGTTPLNEPWVVFCLYLVSLSALTTLSVCHICAFLPEYRLWDAAMTSVSEQ